ncbi:hypothetical protein [Parachlamydia sp. AcF125]|uniref:hypothetical protein n=1 Tax=Parachlamydia sp. AcF125 TaxID=2795736 RepID=UPI0032D5A206
MFCDNAKIGLYFLPPYSPRLNSIERVWKINEGASIYNLFCPGFKGFRAAIFGFFSLLSGFTLGVALGLCFSKRIEDKFRPLGVLVSNF